MCISYTKVCCWKYNPWHKIISPQSLWEDSCLSGHRKTLHTVEHSFSKPPILSHADLPLMSYVACIYGNQWWISLVEKADNSEEDVCINFLHPNGPSAFFHWPSHDERCWVPLMHIISETPQPEPVVAAATARKSSLKYAVSEREQKNISQIFASMNENHQWQIIVYCTDGHFSNYILKTGSVLCNVCELVFYWQECLIPLYHRLFKYFTACLVIVKFNI